MINSTGTGRTNFCRVPHAETFYKVSVSSTDGDLKIAFLPQLFPQNMKSGLNMVPQHWQYRFAGCQWV